MKKVNWIVAILAVAFMWMPFAAIAQTSAEHSTVIPLATATPPDQQPTPDQLAKLFVLMRVKEQMASVSRMMPSLMHQQFDAQLKRMQKDHPEIASQTESQQQASTVNKYMERVIGLYTSDEMMADMASIYQKHLTRSDVDGIIEFYSSPAGQHMLDMLPVIIQEYMPLAMQRTQEKIKLITDEMTKEMEAIAKPSTPAGEKPTPK